MRLHDFVGIESVLQGIARLRFGNERICGDSLGEGELTHHFALRKAVFDGASAQQQPGCGSGTILADALEHARARHVGNGTIVVGGIAQDQDDIEVMLMGVAGRNRKVQEEDAGDSRRQRTCQDREEFARAFHEVILSSHYCYSDANVCW